MSVPNCTSTASPLIEFDDSSYGGQYLAAPPDSPSVGYIEPLDGDFRDIELQRPESFPDEKEKPKSSYQPIRQGRKYTKIARTQNPLLMRFEITDAAFRRFYPAGSLVSYGNTPHYVEGFPEEGKVEIRGSDGTKKIVSLTSIKPPKFKQGDPVFVLDREDPQLKYYEGTVLWVTGRQVVWILLKGGKDRVCISLNRPDILALIFPRSDQMMDSLPIEGVTRSTRPFQIPLDVFKRFYPVGADVRYNYNPSCHLRT